MASGEKWYAKGVGLVKDKGTSVSFWNNETYTSRRETSIVGYIGSGDPFISDSSIHIDKTDLILTKGKTATLTAVTNPEGIPVKWSSSDNNVATVKYRDNTCEITAIAEGNNNTAEITVDGKIERYLRFISNKIFTGRYCCSLCKIFIRFCRRQKRKNKNKNVRTGGRCRIN